MSPTYTGSTQSEDQLAAYLATFLVASCPIDEVQGCCLRYALKFTACLLLAALVPEGPQCELTKLHPRQEVCHRDQPSTQGALPRS